MLRSLEELDEEIYTQDYCFSENNVCFVKLEADENSRVESSENSSVNAQDLFTIHPLAGASALPTIESQVVMTNMPGDQARFTSLDAFYAKQDKKNWSDQEDQFILQQLCNESGTIADKQTFQQIAWSITDRFGKTRTANQIQQRWIRVLDPKVKKGKWTDAEDQILLDCMQKGITSPSELATYISRRTDVQIRYRIQYMRGWLLDHGVIVDSCM